MDNKRLKQFEKNQERLKEIYTNQKYFEETIDLFLAQHCITHPSEVCDLNDLSYVDPIWDSLTDKCFRMIYEPDVGSIAFNLYHAARIEDIVMNIVVTDDEQVYNTENFMDRIGATIPDCGVGITPEEIKHITPCIHMNSLKEYSITVAKKTRTIFQKTSKEAFFSKPTKVQIARLTKEKALRDIPETEWLIGFWRDHPRIEGLYYPMTLHFLSHFDHCIDIKSRWEKE